MNLEKFKSLFNCLCPSENCEKTNIQDFLTDDLIKYFKSENKKIRKSGGTLIQVDSSEIENLKEQIRKLKEQNIKNEKIIEQMQEDEKSKKRKLNDIDEYTYINLLKVFRTEDGKKYGHPDEKKRYEIDDDFYKYDPLKTSFDRNRESGKINYRKYQEDFIVNWSASSQKLVLLYYGVGSGKTLVACNCAEQFLDLNDNSICYLCMPASLVLNTILEFFKFGIDPRRKNSEGKYVYNFVSYQQMIRTKIDFAPNSLLILDEAHNLRNVISVEDKKKVSTSKYESTGYFKYQGNVLGKKLLENSSKFSRCLFMSGTFFVNSSKDLEALISIGYNKIPMYEYLKEQVSIIESDTQMFSQYYSGLISFYRIEKDNENFPRVNYQIELLRDPSYPELPIFKEDPYYVISRNFGNEIKIKWIIDFLKEKKEEKTLIYTQFLESANNLSEILNSKGISNQIISGKLSQSEKMDIVNLYNTNKIKCIIFTLSIKEGISFLETNNFIVFQPYWNYALMEQIIARAIRLTSHKKKQKSLVNVYLLVAFAEKYENKILLNTFKNQIENIMNDDIKSFDKEKLKIDDLNSIRSRDIYIYSKVFNKQNEINDFEKRVLSLKRFDDINNVENNEFTKIFNNSILEYEQKKGKPPTQKEKIMLKTNLYKSFYDDELNKIQNFFKTDKLYKSVDEIQESKDSKKYKKIYDSLKKIGEKSENDDGNRKIIQELLKNKSFDLSYIFNFFGIDKTVIVEQQAFFTPPSQSKKLIEYSKISDDNRQNIYILEPTCGIGNLISELFQLKNKDNFLIDANEYNTIYYTITDEIYKNVDNVKVYNMEFINSYISKYNYDYIIMNPPYVLKDMQIKVFKKIANPNDKRKKNFGYIFYNRTVYDFIFVSKCFNMLNLNGKICAIIRDINSIGENESLKKFLGILKNIKHDIYPVENFKVTDKRKTTKIQETSVKMIYIIMEKTEQTQYIDIYDIMNIYI
jgi:superfamily II DNA or RNA helicase